MENKTISQLNNKMWYRLLKVFFITPFLIVLVASNLMAIYISKVALGRVHLDETSRTKLDGIVQQMQTNNESEDYIQNVVNDFKQKYNQPDVRPIQVIKFFIIINFVILFIFEFVRRAFYYIIFGTIKPQK